MTDRTQDLQRAAIAAALDLMRHERAAGFSLPIEDGGLVLTLGAAGAGGLSNIPNGVYYSAEHDNFYSMMSKRGMGSDFYMEWRECKHIFPQADWKADRLASRPSPDKAAPELLADVRAYIESNSEEAGYGFYRPANPHDFHPDGEMCSEDEIAAHKAACEAFDKGEYTPERGSEWVGKMHILRAPWGMGSYTVRDPQAEALIARIDAASPGAVSPPLVPKAGMTEGEA